MLKLQKQQNRHLIDYKSFFIAFVIGSVAQFYLSQLQVFNVIIVQLKSKLFNS